MNTTARQLLREDVLALTAYPVQPSAGLVKLDAMENPYAWPRAAPAELLEGWRKVLSQVDTNRYPDPSAAPLKAALRQAFDIPAASSIMLGNGSDEIIQIIAMALARVGATLMAPEPSFVMYRMIAGFCGLNYVGVPLADDFSLPVADFIAAMQREQPAVVFIAQPNNPTGNLFDPAGLRRIVEQAPGLVVIDEAYGPFCDFTAMGWLAEYPNVLVMRTLSKFGLAGLRLGYVCGAPAWLDEFDKLRLPYNINGLTQAGAGFALAHRHWFAERAAVLCAQRSSLAAALAALPGIQVYPSAANFLLLRVPAGQAGTLHQGLRKAGILIKNLHGAHPALADHLRVTVGTEEENQLFISALEGLLRRHW